MTILVVDALANTIFNPQRQLSKSVVSLKFGEIRIACQADAGLRFSLSFTTAMTGKGRGSLKLGK